MSQPEAQPRRGNVSPLRRGLAQIAKNSDSNAPCGVAYLGDAADEVIHVESSRESPVLPFSPRAWTAVGAIQHLGRGQRESRRGRRSAGPCDGELVGCEGERL